MQWYKVPTQKALLVLYYGALPYGEIAGDTAKLESEKLGKTRFVKEAEVTGEAGVWCNLAYDLAQKNAAPIFQQIGGSGFEGAEPTTVFLTKDSAFVLLNFKYSGIMMGKQKGQMLAALEFSRSSKKYKALYELNTTLINKPTSDAFTTTFAYVGKALIDVGIHAALQ